ncbi:tRNA (guanosine(37)-N1)-methyltransferase TrmD [Pseudobacteriovorax antillogorgiicola]|uniref:tRNA (guanine-N(1)-)-methyltransferase n=1 Tax=Pseudobacteriovorax antillogorgiicola TaxID=1513793 RepID=A0A1Y6BZV6_9BACT|nr:tRNA (guanosine(37)-N1)-methyltransferase TrmD [Pseudobacteriovorax antillogorgiicola]TCS50313.1 tRNA (guanine37-N(1)-) methyltransferase [Pseudobacteriovorax antillogorgiicola]SMF34122.1 tRNA (Guanine37-N(1)-) methyltransferase [Pseudobacteriovorax antillogorgiicola]
MKRFSFITIHPQFIESYLSFGVFKSAQDRGLVSVDIINLRDFAVDRHGSVDDRAYGGGDGMIMRPEPLAQAVNHIRTPQSFVIFPSPHGQSWSHQNASQLTSSQDKQHLIFICGRFGGIDQRFIDRYVDLQVSMGDFVVSGGELPSLLMSDSILRLVPGVLGNQDSSELDSFSPGLSGLLEHPQYTRPLVFEGCEVPAVLRSGNHKAIEQWKHQQSKAVTEQYRPDLLSKSEPDPNA